MSRPATPPAMQCERRRCPSSGSCVRRAHMPTRSLLDLPYFHLMYAGATRTSPSAAGQDGALRALLYPPDAGPLPDHSPRRNEFVFLGYAFSLVAVEGGVDERVRELSIVVALCSAVFRRFERVCDAVARVLADTASICDRPELLRLQETVQVEYEDLLSPTLSYRHELLVLREGLFVWAVSHSRTGRLEGGEQGDEDASAVSEARRRRAVRALRRRRRSHRTARYGGIRALRGVSF